MIGAIMVVGAIGLFDLRVLGYGHGIDRLALKRASVPVALIGFVVMVASGAVLFAADAEALAGSRLFGAKLILILLAGLNALAFHRVSRDALASPLLKVMAALSLVFWLGVVTLGRLIAYF